MNDERGDFVSPVDAGSPVGDFLRRLNLLCIDEVTMASAHLLHTVDLTLRDVRGVQFPFGGLTVVLTGDWLQLPAVVRGAHSLGTVCLTISERQKEDPHFYQLLCKIAEGRAEDIIDLPTTCSQLVATSFLQPSLSAGEIDMQSVYLCSTNVMVNFHNSRLLALFPGEGKHFEFCRFSCWRGR